MEPALAKHDRAVGRIVLAKVEHPVAPPRGPPDVDDGAVPDGVLPRAREGVCVEHEAGRDAELESPTARGVVAAPVRLGRVVDAADPALAHGEHADRFPVR